MVGRAVQWSLFEHIPREDYFILITRRGSPQASRRRRALGGGMKSPVVKRSIVIGGHKTSVSLEDAFWGGLKEIASNRRLTLSQLLGSIDSERLHGNLSSGLRLYVLDYYRGKIGAMSAGGNATVERAASGARIAPESL